VSATAAAALALEAALEALEAALRALEAAAEAEVAAAATEVLRSAPSTTILSALTVPALRISLPPISRSAAIAFGVLPSRDRVLSKASLRASKFAVIWVEDSHPEDTVVIVGCFATITSFLSCLLVF
jgi:hypothetical protein